MKVYQNKVEAKKATIEPGENDRAEKRVLIFMPTGRDAPLVCATLDKADIDAQICLDVVDLETKVAEGVGAILIAEEALHNGALDHLTRLFNNQPVWSDLPIVMFAGSGRNAEILLETLGTRFNATIVERPIRVTMLISAVRGALRAREKQYQTRDLLNQLEEADRQKDLFLATLSHELRTPLNSILGWLQLIRGKSDIDTGHALDVIERNAKAQAEMVADILFVSRVITGKLTLNPVKTDLIPVVQAAIDIVIPSIEAKQIHLQTNFEENLPPVKADSDRLQQVFWNLLSNAIKFTPQRGRIQVFVRGKNENIEVEITDSGRGINLEFLPFVFERFRQADNSYTRQVGGLGLGLAIVRHLAELHGGTVSAASDGENKGASFFVTLPVFREIDSPTSLEQSFDEPDDRPAETDSLKSIRLLLVEDDEDSREMLKVMFEQYDIQVTAASTAAEALTLVKETKPDILISDVGLPGEDGYDLIDQIRCLPPEQGGQTPAVALTGYVSPEDRHRALEAGYQEHLSKPVDIDELLDMVRKLLH